MQVITDSYGNVRYYRDDQLHRDDDLPAVEYADGALTWCVNGKLHRDNDLPAVIHTDGTFEWYVNDKEHRKDLPAVINFNGIL